MTWARDICAVCGQAGEHGHEHTNVALCAEHASWWAEALTERTDASCWRGEDLCDDAHDELLQDMRHDYAASQTPVMTADPLDGLSLWGVGGAA